MAQNKSSMPARRSRSRLAEAVGEAQVGAGGRSDGAGGGPPESPTAGVPERLPVRTVSVRSFLRRRSFRAEAGSGGRERPSRRGEKRIRGASQDLERRALFRKSA